MKIFKIVFITFILSFFFGCGKSKDTNVISASGTIETVNVTLSSKQPGQIKHLFFDEGDKVKEGDLLMEIDHALLDIQLRQAQAGIDFAKAQLRLLKSGARKEDIKIAYENLRQSQINLEQAKNDLERYSSLLKSASITQKQFDDAQSKYNLLLAQFNSAKENYSKLKSFTRPEEIESAQANLLKAISSADLISKSIEDCKVYSPINGFITKKYIEKGENVNVSSSLFKISNLETVDLVIYVREPELGKIKLGGKAEISVDSFRDKKFYGDIIYISNEAEFTPKNIQTQDERTKLVYAVKIRIPNPDFELKAGMPADAKITL
jgi:HlyD family secretion protein